MRACSAKTACSVWKKPSRPVYFAPTAGRLTFTRSGSTLSGSFESEPGGELEKNYVSLSPNGFDAVKEQLAAADPAFMDALVKQRQSALF